ncbi:MAG: phage major tail protein, TP901-1 family [Anaerostipes sp.]|uniref:phage major tail protein, TP901-1 family n=1 Tax=Anaerostipes sp. TaxID=1872530 RepID=UPI00399421E4
MELQLFANEAVQGKKLVYLYRILSKAATTDGATLAFTTENGRTKSKDADSTATKDGSIRTPGAAEVEITATSILKKGDTLIEDLEKALDDDALIEIWEVNLAEPATDANKFKGKYFQGYLTEIEHTANADEFVEVSMTFGINGNGETGEVTVTTKQQEQAYAFADTVKTGA